MMHDSELTDDELETITDVLGYAADETVTDQERAAIHNAHHTIVEQWDEQR